MGDATLMARRRAAAEAMSSPDRPPAIGEFTGRPHSPVELAREERAACDKAMQDLMAKARHGLGSLFGRQVADSLVADVEHAHERALDACRQYERALERADLETEGALRRAQAIQGQRDRLLTAISVAGEEMRRRYRDRVPEPFAELLDVARCM